MSERPAPTLLTLDRLAEAEGFEAALSGVMPKQPSYELLEAVRTEVLTFLDWATQDLAANDPQGAQNAIRRACLRLSEVAALYPGAIKTARQGAQQFSPSEAQALLRDLPPPRP